ncbi:hypothetical protein [Loigolactobacillus jiayinensis]|uniref:DUF5082 domain-containing protein n=1 Tax=Loigolactobacillus jiayinensis TaxID=2486016 RepID=A0ABW1R8H4_9LACO|nr:hypothetical protein [Loigolactobacillus jiayinensis]
MVKVQQVMAHYAQVVDQLIQTTERLTGDLNGDYELLKSAISTDTVDDISNDQWTSIKANFKRGVAEYEANLATVKAVRPPAKALGIHHLLLSAYTDYVAGCAQMAASVDDKAHTIDVAAFKAAEKQQDDSSLALNKQIARIAQILR